MIDAVAISIGNHNGIIIFLQGIEGLKERLNINKTTDISMSNKYPSMSYPQIT